MNPMNKTPLFLSLAALAGLSSCSMEPCLSRSFPGMPPACRHRNNSPEHRDAAIHLGTPAGHAGVGSASADNREAYHAQPGT